MLCIQNDLLVTHSLPQLLTGRVVQHRIPALLLNMMTMQDILARDLAEGQYFVTGDLTPEVFADNCRQVRNVCSCCDCT